ncbi:hypothetical protein NESM_000588400 [Novymonas esmeraldas]|uniref:Uncharacterized protein n=1 Tax=Novymonas esmeraldas TaxID=1808958 RepID=A0AAW0ESI6_9TRYP
MEAEGGHAALSLGVLADPRSSPASDAAPSSPSLHRRHRERRQVSPQTRRALPPRPCTAVVGVPTLLRGCESQLCSSPTKHAAAAHLGAECASSMPSSCGATVETDSRHDGAPTRPLAAVIIAAAAPLTLTPASSSLSLPVSAVPLTSSTVTTATAAAAAAAATTAAAGGSSSARRLTPWSSTSLGEVAPLHFDDGARQMSLERLRRTPPALDCLSTDLRDSTALLDLAPHADSSRPATGGSCVPLLCCGPPQQHASERQRRASSADMFLALAPAPSPPPVSSEDAVLSASSPMSPMVGGRLAGVDVLSAAWSGTTGADARELTTPLVSSGVGSGSARSSGSAGITVAAAAAAAAAAATRSVQQRRSRSFDTPHLLSAAAAAGYGSSCDDLSRCYAERRDLSTITASCRTSEHARERQDDVSRPPPVMHPSVSAVTVSTMTAPLGGETTTHTTAAHNAGSGDTGVSGGDTEGSLGVRPGLRRAVSCDTLASISSSHSRPVLTPPAVGPAAISGAASGTTTVSTTTSVTYTRKNVCLGTLDFYGQPITSLSTLLVQMSLRSGGEHDDADPPEPRPGAVCSTAPGPQHPTRNTLSMQNLKAHTQQMGEMAPEDKVERFRAKPDAAAPTGATGTHGYAAAASTLRRRHTYTKFSSMAATTTMTGTAAPPPTIGAAAAAAASAAASAKQRVGSLKDVLQECQFLSLNDVLSAIADTHVHELREAQQQLGRGHDVLCDGDPQRSTAPPATTGEVSAACAPLVPSHEPAMTAAVRGETADAPLPDVATTSIPLLQASLSSIDPQRALTLAAAITEVSLNLDRSTEASLAGSTLAAASSAPAPSATSRALLSRHESTTVGTFSIGEHTSSGAISASFPAVPVCVAVSHPSTAATPTRLRSTVLSSSRSSTTAADTGRGVAPVLVPETFMAAAAAAVTVDGLGSPDAATCPCDPLECKVLRSMSVDDVDSAVARRRWDGAEDRHVRTPTSPGATATPTAATLRVTRRRERRSLVKWHGLSAADDDAPVANTRPIAAVVVVNELRSYEAPEETWVGADSGGVCGRSGAGDHAETCKSTATVTVASSAEANTTTTPTTTGSTVASLTDVRLVIESIACASIEDELSNTAQLRRWARSAARLELLQPSTNTEVTT